VKEDEHDTFDAGFHGLPPMRKLKRMSFSELAMELQQYESGSAAYLVVQREMNLKSDRSIFKKPWFLWFTTAALGLIGVALKFFG